MSLKEAITNSLLMFVAATCVVLIVKAVPQSAGTQPAIAASNTAAGTSQGLTSSGSPTPAMQDGINVYYLHGNIRCPTCRTIESNAKEAVETGFADQLKSGQIQWSVINYESPGNEHFATDFEVVAPTVVFAKFAGGQQVAWKGLPEVWEYVDDKAAFTSFVQRSLRAFIGGEPSTTSVLTNPMRSTSGSELNDLPIPE